MARYTGSVCRQCRREGLRLYLKGQRCYTDKCAVERHPYPPGQHGRARARYSEYRLQLREKQKVKRHYGVLEKQFRKYFTEAERRKGITGENLLQLLEVRLDNVVYRLGFARSRREARQLVRHGHLEVNGRRVNIPSFSVREGQTITIREKSRSSTAIQGAIEVANQLADTPEWLEVDRGNFTGSVKMLPMREHLTMPFEEQLIVELYSK